MKVKREQIKELCRALGYSTEAYRPDLSSGKVVWGFTAEQENGRIAQVRIRIGKPKEKT